MLGHWIAAASLCAAAGLTTPAPGPSTIVGGSDATTCQWPASVSVSGCSATLVHPEIILYAAHCGGAPTARFGETAQNPAFTVGTDFCRDNPGYFPGVPGTDSAYCRLSQPVTEVPIAPILMGCEVDELVVGSRVTIVGFGRQTPGGQGAGGPSGRKKYIDVPVAGFPSDGRLVGLVPEDPNEGACFGDSGGSTYVQLADGSWRAVGITATLAGTTCPAQSQHTPMWNAVGWVEADSGFDITPCHDADGTWNPGPDCTGAVLDPGNGGGQSWANSCSDAPIGGAIATCGPAFGEDPDVLAPQVAIANPLDGASFADNSVDLTVQVDVDGLDGFGVREVVLLIADEEPRILEGPPWEIDATFPLGTWQLRATATDWSGNVGESVVTFEVGAGAGETGGPNPGDTGGGATTTTTTGPGDGGETGASGPPATDDGGDGGCGCRTNAPTGLAWLLVGVGCAVRRRREESPARREESPARRACSR